MQYPLSRAQIEMWVNQSRKERLPAVSHDNQHISEIKLFAPILLDFHCFKVQNKTMKSDNISEIFIIYKFARE